MPPASPEAREALDGSWDGAYEAFRERVTWFYKNAPECQEARKHSFSRQGDVAFALAMAERRAARDAELRAGIETLERWGVAHIEGEDVLCPAADGDYLDRFDVLTLLTPET